MLQIADSAHLRLPFHQLASAAAALQSKVGPFVYQQPLEFLWVEAPALSAHHGSASWSHGPARSFDLYSSQPLSLSPSALSAAAVSS